MPNIRIAADNALERATSLTASTTSGSLAASNLTTGTKSDVWRATGTSASLKAAWSTAEAIQLLAAWPCNWSPSATWRVRLTNEAQATNLLTFSNDFAQAAWVKANLAALATGVAGPDGTNSATTLTASAANGEIYQTASNAGNATASIWIRRRTGSGAVSIRNTANSAWIALALTTSWKRFTNDGGSNASTAALDILIATSGDAIDIAFGQIEAGAAATSYYPTTSASATRPLGYIDSWQSYDYDSGVVSACPAPEIKLRGFTAAQASSAYGYGGGAAATHWMPAAHQAVGLAIDIVDTNNRQGYLEVGFLVASSYWEAAKNADYGASATPLDLTKNTRTDAGDLVSALAPRAKKVQIPMSKLDPSDQTAVWNILTGNGVGWPVWVSLFPEDSDLDLERRHQVYGKLVQLPAMALPSFNIATATLEVESL